VKYEKHYYSGIETFRRLKIADGGED